MQIRLVTQSDIPSWEAISTEYDAYVMELVDDLSQWYEGNGGAASFAAYMRSKTAQEEAFMAVDSGNCCLGVVAFSKRNNNVTFFGISHGADFDAVGGALLLRALDCLDGSREIRMHAIASQSGWMERHRRLMNDFGFVHAGDALENGVPVGVFLKLP